MDRLRTEARSRCRRPHPGESSGTYLAGYVDTAEQLRQQTTRMFCCNSYNASSSRTVRLLVELLGGQNQNYDQILLENMTNDTQPCYLDIGDY